MKEWIKLGLILTFSMSLLTGCIELEEDEDDEEDADIAGVWDLTYTDPDDGQDVMYIHISASGSITLYDYYGDELDNGENCYDVIPLGSITRSSENEFTFSWQDSTTTYTSNVEIEGDEAYITNFYSNEGVKSTLLTSDFSPECSS